MVTTKWTKKSSGNGKWAYVFFDNFANYNSYDYVEKKKSETNKT